MDPALVTLAAALILVRSLVKAGSLVVLLTTTSVHEVPLARKLGSPRCSQAIIRQECSCREQRPLMLALLLREVEPLSFSVSLNNRRYAIS